MCSSESTACHLALTIVPAGSAAAGSLSARVAEGQAELVECGIGVRTAPLAGAVAAEVSAQLSDPATYRERGDEVSALNARLAELNQLIEGGYERWSELEERSGQ